MDDHTLLASLAYASGYDLPNRSPAFYAKAAARRYNGGMDEPLAYLNGRFIPASEAAISVTDAGFVLGAAVAEQVRTFSGKLFRLEEHLARLFESLRTVGVETAGVETAGVETAGVETVGVETAGVEPEPDARELAELAEELVSRNHRLLDGGDDLGLSIVVTPGPYSTFAPAGASARPTVCMHTYPLPFRLWAAKYGSGQALVTSEVEQVSEKCWPPGLKCRSRMHYYLAERQAARIDPDARALLLDHDGLVAEASTCNILVFRSDEGLLSPPMGSILRGISLKVTIELAGRLGIRFSERPLAPSDVATADELLLTGTSPSLLPANRLDGRPIGDGKPGPIFSQLLAAWSDLAGVDIAAQANRFSGR